MVAMNVTVIPYDPTVYRAGTLSVAGVCTWCGDGCTDSARGTVVEHLASGVDRRWAACDSHKPQSTE